MIRALIIPSPRTAPIHICLLRVRGGRYEDASTSPVRKRNELSVLGSTRHQRGLRGGHRPHLRASVPGVAAGPGQTRHGQSSWPNTTLHAVS